MPNIQPPLVQAVWKDLDEDAREFAEAKWKFEQARYHMEVARKRFGATKSVASGVMSHEDWRMWGEAHPEVKYVGMPMGDAIKELLLDRAFEHAIEVVQGKAKRFIPGMLRDDILADLERGGFEFKGVTPLRELNAALINLTEVDEGRHGYQHVDAEAAFRWAQDEHGKD